MKTAIKVEMIVEIEHDESIPTDMLADFIGYLAHDCDQLATPEKIDEYIMVTADTGPEEYRAQAQAAKEKLSLIEGWGGSTRGLVTKEDPYDY